MVRESPFVVILWGCLLGGYLSVSPACAQSAIDSRLDGEGTFRNRLSMRVESAIGPLSAFVDETCVRGRLGTPVAGLSTPPFDLGPLREGGLLREMNHPFGLASISETSQVSLDRSVAGAVSPGGVMRFALRREGRSGVDVYALHRGGLAPSQTASGGIVVRSPAVSLFDFDIATKLTSFGLRKQEEDWMLQRPDLAPPALVKGAARLSGRLCGFRGNLSSGVALSDRIRPAGFFSGFLGLSTSLPLASEHAPASLHLAGRLDGGLADPFYYDDDGRFVRKTALLHPVVSLRLPGLRVAASYGYTAYRLPPQPVLYRRIVQSGSLRAVVEFGLLEIGSGFNPSLEYTEEGRILLRQTSSLSAELRVGRARLRGDIELRQRNDSAEEAKGGLHFLMTGELSTGELALEMRKEDFSLGVDVLFVLRQGSLRLGVELAGLEFESTGRGIALGGGLAGLPGHLRLALSWQARSL